VSGSGSVSFDRAAEYYDRTRGLSDEGIRRTTEALASIFDAGPGPDLRVLEVGIGTGQVALPLSRAGVGLAGIDLARPMLAALVAKEDGVVPFPLVEGDAGRLPFRDDAFAGAYLRWVLHLIADWRASLREIRRIVRPGGRFAASLGSYGGIRSEIQERFVELAGVSLDPVGLAWEAWDELEREMSALGATRLEDLTFTDLERDDLETFVRSMEANRFSWTWAVTDEELRRRAVEETRRWAEERFGSLDAVPRERFELGFAVFRFGG
jgi:SAM-dependent methyltransferase